MGYFLDSFQITMKPVVAMSVLALQATAALLPVDHQGLEPRATTSAAVPACTPNSDVVVNGGFYGSPNPDTYAPFKLAPTVGSPGCQYTHGYTPCMGSSGYGAVDPDCLYLLPAAHTSRVIRRLILLEKLV